MTNVHRTLCAEIGLRLDAAVASAAAATGAELLAASALSRDPPGRVGRAVGHRLGVRRPVAGGVVPYHPNAAGMRAVADAMAAVLA